MCTLHEHLFGNKCKSQNKCGDLLCFSSACIKGAHDQLTGINQPLILQLQTCSSHSLQPSWSSVSSSSGIWYRISKRMKIIMHLGQMAFKLNYNESGQSSVDIKRGLLKFSLKFFRKSKEIFFMSMKGLICL